MTELLVNSIIEEIIKVPGLAGLTTVDLAAKPLFLNKENFHKSLSLVQDEHSKSTIINITLAIIIEVNINSKAVCSEIVSAIKNLFKLNGVKMGKVNIYIRGVK